MHERSFSIRARAPFRLDLTAGAPRRRPDNAVDRWDGRAYRRVLAPGGGPVEVTAVQSGPPARPRLEVTLVGFGVDARTEGAVRQLLARTLGLELDLRSFIGSPRAIRSCARSPHASAV